MTRSVEEIEDDLLFKAGLSVTPEEIAELIRLVKTLDPAGIGAPRVLHIGGQNAY